MEVMDVTLEITTCKVRKNWNKIGDERTPKWEFMKYLVKFKRGSIWKDMLDDEKYMFC